MSFANLVNYLLYVIPGFLSVEIYRSTYPAKKDSDFVRLAWSIIYGVIIYTIAVKLIAGFSWQVALNTDQVPSLRAIALLFGLAAIGGYLRVGWQTTRFTLSRRFSLLQFLRPRSRPTWAEINSEEPTEWAVVTLKDGTRYMGFISNWTFDPDAKDQEFILSEAKRVDEDLNPLYEIKGRGVYLKTGSIDRIEFWAGV